MRCCSRASKGATGRSKPTIREQLTSNYRPINSQLSRTTTVRTDMPARRCIVFITIKSRRDRLNGVTKQLEGYCVEQVGHRRACRQH